MLARLVLAAWIIVGAGGSCGQAIAQNDWQFPDPRFGSLVVRSRPPPEVDERRYRREISPPLAQPHRVRAMAQPHDGRRGRLRRR